MTEILLKPIRKEVKKPRRYSLDEYFKKEEKAFEKHEYFDGIIKRTDIIPFEHSRLSVKTLTTIYNFLEEKDLESRYNISSSQLKVYIRDYNLVFYPNALVITENPKFLKEKEDTFTNPIVVIEAVSKAQKRFNSSFRFEMYRSIPTFKEYVLIHQDKKKVSVYTKQVDSTWILKDYEGEEAVAILFALHNCPLPLSRLYKGLLL